MQGNVLENGLFYIKDEEFKVEGDQIIHRYKVAGDLTWAKEFQYIQIQCMIDRMVRNDQA